MTSRRWIADEITGSKAALTGAHADHLVRVLRAQVGQEFDISSGKKVWRGRIAAILPERVEFELGEEIPSQTEVKDTELKLTLLLAVFKFDRMEWAIEKCTELGVAKIVPVIAQRTDAHLAKASSRRVERWRRLALQAAEQSRQVGAPEIAAPTSLKDAVALPATTRIVLAEREDRRSLKDVLQSAAVGRDLLLAIGPEGGWTEGEQRHFGEAGWVSASLGGNILRAETAAIAAVAIVLAEVA
jgi:16S rRNA (uracil1498-N3)-methyltransferase